MLRAAREAAESGPVELLVVTGDSDMVVPVRASRRTAELLGVASTVVEMAETGHLPMVRVVGAPTMLDTQ